MIAQPDTPTPPSPPPLLAQRTARHVVVRSKDNMEPYIGPLDFDELADIIRKVNDTDIVALDLNSKRFGLSLKKQEALEKPEPIYVQVRLRCFSIDDHAYMSFFPCIFHRGFYRE